MASQLTIYNRALLKVGSQPASSLTENRPSVIAANTVYDSIRVAELRTRSWNFAIKRVTLAPDADAPAFTKSVAFTLPSDFLRLLPTDPETNSGIIDLQIEGDKILTSVYSTELNLRYIYNVTDVNEMDPAFQEVLAARLALEICEPVTQSNTKYNNIAQWYQRSLIEAAKANAFENRPVESFEDSWITARN